MKSEYIIWIEFKLTYNLKTIAKAFIQIIQIGLMKKSTVLVEVEQKNK